MSWTLREMALFGEGQALRDKEAWRQRVTIAHLGETLARQKRLPPLADVLTEMSASTGVSISPKERRSRFISRMDHMVAVSKRKAKNK